VILDSRDYIPPMSVVLPFI